MINSILNNRVPIFIRIVVPLVILIIITVGLSGYYVYCDSTERAGIDLGKRLERAAPVVADSVSRETLSHLKMSTLITWPTLKFNICLSRCAPLLTWTG